MISIGVVGHRFFALEDRLKSGIDQALSRIDLLFAEEVWSILSSLAEGADRLVVERILSFRPRTHLIVPLPLPLENYRMDFSSPDSLKEFDRLLAKAADVILLPETACRDESYRMAGIFIVEHAEVLIALWDGRGALGKGGTGDIVETARKKGLPLAWIQCGNRQPWTKRQPDDLRISQGKVVFERF